MEKAEGEAKLTESKYDDKIGLLQDSPSDQVTVFQFHPFFSRLLYVLQSPSRQWLFETAVKINML